MSRREWPPGEGAAPAPPGADTAASPSPSATTQVTTGLAAECSDTGRLWCGDTVPAQLRRRRAASRRLPVLDGGYSDPVRPWRPEKLSSVQVAGVAAAAAHLRDIGCLPLFDLPTLRSLYRRGGRDRALAIELRELCGREVA